MEERLPTGLRFPPNGILDLYSKPVKTMICLFLDIQNWIQNVTLHLFLSP